jgi:hypothetical protein
MGVVMGTSHHEPMTRAQSEWHRLSDDPSTGGAWNYETNGENLRRFWRGGIERMMSKGRGKAFENVVTIGMRGDGDAPMTEGTATQLLETIVSDQRRILEETTGRPARETPQVWALYKEVQDYYDHGMQVPDDVTLLFSDDNWGQIRRLPIANLDRPGGFGVYYHFDYVGAPRNYKWINTNQVGKIWQQMNLAYEAGARSIWVVNVGDLKPMEHPIDFFMKMAWDPEAMTPAALAQFPEDWAKRQFGPGPARQIGRLMSTYSRYAASRKPELINETTWPIGEAKASVLERGEFDRYVEDWRALSADMQGVKARLNPLQHDAFFQLIEYPILALSNLYEMYCAAAWNRRLAPLNDLRANHFKNAVETAFSRDRELTAAYHALAGGKWDGMMAQVHMSYVAWNDPAQQTMPAVVSVPGNGAGNHDAGVRFVDPPRRAGAPIEIEAAAFSRSSGAGALRWETIAHIGQSGAALVALPQGRAASGPDDHVCVEYDIAIPTPGDWRIGLELSPTLDTSGGGVSRVGISLDEDPVQILTFVLTPTPSSAHTGPESAWWNAVINNRHTVEGVFAGVAAGRRVVKIWRLDDNVVIEKIVLTAR